MKKILITGLIITISMFMAQKASAVCIQCPEIQKEFKKEVKLNKHQKAEIKKIKKDMYAQIKGYQKEYDKNQKQISKILKADCPDIVTMVEIKNRNSNIKNDILVAKKEAYANIFDVYTPDQQYIAKRILSENTGITTKGNCEFCNNRGKIQTKCDKCKDKKKS